MEPKPSAQEEFLKGLGEDQKATFAEPASSEKETDKKVDTDVSEEETEEEAKNRRERRLIAKIQKEREANIALNERVKTLTEQDRFVKDNSKDVDPDILKLFAQDESGKAGAALLQKKLQEIEERASERAYRQLQEARDADESEQAKAEEFIDNQLESLEEKYNIDLTSNSPRAKKARTEFLEVVERLSPKDTDGSIKDYADFDGAFDIYRTSKKEVVDNSRNKEVAARSMTRSGTTTPTESKTFKTNNGFQEFANYLRSQE